MTAPLHWTAAETAAKTFTNQWASDTPGGAILGFDQDGIRFALCGGAESLSTGKAFTSKSVVRYASVTKHAFCTFVLTHPDLISLDDTLGSHLPELQEPLARVTVGRALDMSGGLPDTREALSLLGLSVYTETQAPALLEFLARMTRLNFEAGTEVSYSNTGYRLVEAALERKGVFFRDYITKAGADCGAVLDAPDVWNDTVANLVPGYWHNGQKWQLSAAGLHISASGSMTGSAESLSFWLQDLLKNQDMLDAMAAPRALKDGRLSGYGLGLAKTTIGDRDFIGHGGSHPGYKTYFLLDRQNSCGFVIVSNREDTNGGKIAQSAMAALHDLALPVPSIALIDGLYVTETGANWLEVKGSTVVSLDADDTAYDDGQGWISSRSATSPMRLKMEGHDIVGEVGHAAHHYHPANSEPIAESVSGRWLSSEGARFEIDGSELIMGIGPTRRRMPLQALGGGRFLFTLHDGPWTKRVCLNVLDDSTVELVLNRARMMEYRRDR
ncbi:serine hydrolase domain-containing protein [Rhizobium oryziradicis]|uniref:Serine hydrolase n=1 Tax=Rhizobium oryziradicis TaxID=1867956 RepID=A0A1Q8ZW06_9HYPH|nr:serine hydrolase [Rhizobium oryziradicis]OLP46253.1 serine hydrolase [Rhizobium oryziradicis]